MIPQTSSIVKNKTQEKIKFSEWKNIFYMKDGRSFIQPFIFPSEIIAREIADKFTSAGRELGPFGEEYVVVDIDTNKPLFKFKEFSHHIQVAVENS